ncbi:Hypothetical predicted protein, partial [Pelobates cultripes]
NLAWYTVRRSTLSRPREDTTRLSPILEITKLLGLGDAVATLLEDPGPARSTDVERKSFMVPDLGAPPLSERNER